MNDVLVVALVISWLIFAPLLLRPLFYRRRQSKPKLTALDREAAHLEQWLRVFTPYPDSRTVLSVAEKVGPRRRECFDHGSCALPKSHLDDEVRASERWHQDRVGRRWNNDTGEDTGR